MLCLGSEPTAAALGIVSEQYEDIPLESNAVRFRHGNDQFVLTRRIEITASHEGGMCKDIALEDDDGLTPEAREIRRAWIS